MTTQIPDFFMYEDNLYEVVGINGKGLILPQDFGVSSTGFSTACLRGHCLEYAILEENLNLASLSLLLSKNDEHKKINDTLPVGDTDHFFDPSFGRFLMYKYPKLNIPIPYSGGILIVKDFVREFGVAEFPQSYETVFELLFDNGKLTKVIDWSGLIAKERSETLANRPNKPNFVVEFSLKYDFFYFNHMNQYV